MPVGIHSLFDVKGSRKAYKVDGGHNKNPLLSSGFLSLLENTYKMFISSSYLHDNDVYRLSIIYSLKSPKFRSFPVAKNYSDVRVSNNFLNVQ
jgi:hypothetical protein